MIAHFLASHYQSNDERKRWYKGWAVPGMLKTSSRLDKNPALASSNVFSGHRIILQGKSTPSDISMKLSPIAKLLIYPAWDLEGGCQIFSLSLSPFEQRCYVLFENTLHFLLYYHSKWQNRKLNNNKAAWMVKSMLLVWIKYPKSFIIYKALHGLDPSYVRDGLSPVVSVTCYLSVRVDWVGVL